MSLWWIAALAWLAVFVATLGACAMAARAERRDAALRADRRAERLADDERREAARPLHIAR